MESWLVFDPGGYRAIFPFGVNAYMLRNSGQARPDIGRALDLPPGGGALVVNAHEAAQVREIYRLYLELGSPTRIVEEIERRGWRLKSFTTRKGRGAGDAPFTRTTLYNLLTNPVYAGIVRHKGEDLDIVSSALLSTSGVFLALLLTKTTFNIASCPRLSTARNRYIHRPATRI